MSGETVRFKPEDIAAACGLPPATALASIKRLMAPGGPWDGLVRWADPGCTFLETDCEGIELLKAAVAWGKAQDAAGGSP